MDPAEAEDPPGKERKSMHGKVKSRDITIIALGIALYIVFSLFIPVRVVGNYFLCFGYLVMVIYPYLFGSFAGGLVGLLGTLIYCLIEGSFGGIVGWTLGNTFIGVALGILFDKSRKIMKKEKKSAVEVVFIVTCCAIAFLLIKPLFESIVAKIPFMIRLAANMPAFLMDSFVMLIGYPLALYFDSHYKFHK